MLGSFFPFGSFFFRCKSIFKLVRNRAHGVSVAADAGALDLADSSLRSGNGRRRQADRIGSVDESEGQTQQASDPRRLPPKIPSARRILQSA